MLESLGNIDHVAIVVENMAKSIKFYERFFGFKIERKFGNRSLGIQATVLKKQNSRLELFFYSDKKSSYAKNLKVLHGKKVPKSYFEPGIKHIAFRTAQFSKSVKSLSKAGIQPWIPPKTGYSGDSITFFPDPNGVLLEIVSPINRKKGSK